MKQTARVVAALALLGCGNKSNDKPEKRSGSGTNVATNDTNDGKDEPKDQPPAPTVKAGGKGDCKTDYAPRPKRDPNPMCKIDGGTFTMGDDNERMAAKVSPYYIDQFEVTAAQVAHYLNATNGRLDCKDLRMDGTCFFLSSSGDFDPTNGHYVVKKDGRYVVAPGYEHHPFIDGSHSAAAEYCAWAGKKLPTEAQWEFAARHDPATNKDYVYPWGDVFDPTRLRCDFTICTAGPQDALPVPIGLFDGSPGHGDGRSPWGLFDMSGNANEHVLGCSNDYHPCTGGPCVDPPGEPARKNQPCGITTRGGSSYDAKAQLTTSYRSDNGGAGFRCAR